MSHSGKPFHKASHSSSLTAQGSITDAVLWVDHPELMLERVCGLTVLERQLFVLARAAIRRVWIAARRPSDADRLRLPAGLEVQWIAREGDGPVECRPPYIGYSGDYFVKEETLAHLLGGSYSEHASLQDEGGRSVIQVIPYRGERVVQFDRRPMPGGSCTRVQLGGADRPRVEGWLLATARKAHDGLMARVFDRHISLRMTRWLLGTPVTPNQMTVLSSALGCVGALELARPGYAAGVAGALLVWLHSVLDGCDGELARLRYQESRFGGTLDFWGDNLVHVLLFSCLGVGLHRAGAGAWTVASGIIAAASSLTAAAVTFRLSVRRSEAGPLFKGIALEPPATAPLRTLQRIEDFLTQRDFIYLLVVAALFSQLPAFLIAAAVGSPIFLAVLLYLTAQGEARGAPPAPAGATQALTPSPTRGTHA